MWEERGVNMLEPLATYGLLLSESSMDAEYAGRQVLQTLSGYLQAAALDHWLIY